MSSEKQIEQEIQAKGLTAPRITPDHIDGCIVSEHYFIAGEAAGAIRSSTYPEALEKCAALDCLTFCVLVLKNGFTVTGESACASPENFNAEIGRKIARENAREKIWLLEGYALKQRLHEASQIPVDANFIGGLTSDGTIAPVADSEIQPHQQRVIDEKAALDKNAKALSVFISVNPVFETLDPAEQERMKVQNDLMWQYSEVLGQRIAAFGGSAAPEFRTSTKDSGC